MSDVSTQRVQSLLAVSCKELVAGLSDPVVIVDVAERISYLNSAAEIAFGASAKVGLVGRVCCAEALFGEESFVHVTNGGDQPEGWSLRDDIERVAPHYDRSLVIDNPRIGRRHMSLDAIPLHSDFGGKAGVALVFRDRTEEIASIAEGEWLRDALFASRKQIERELSRTRLLEAVGVAAASAMDLAAIGDAVLDAIARTQWLTGGALMVLDCDDRMRLATSRGLSAKMLQRFEPPAGAQPASRGLCVPTEDHANEPEGEAMATADILKDPDSRQLSIPIKYRGRTMGALLLEFEGSREFEQDELDTYATVSDVLGQAIENARLYEAEHRIAETLQETLVVLPSHVPGISFSRAYESATYEVGRVGGDFVDVFQADGNLVGITLGDVSGKGIDAAVTTSTIRTTLRVHALDGRAPAEIAEKANEVMRRFSEVESFVTLWFGLLNTTTGHLRYVCAGHPPALIVNEHGEVGELECHDPILGAFPDVRYYECSGQLAPGDTLVLYSDGVTEARAVDGRFLDSFGLLQLLESKASLPSTKLAPALMSDVVRFSDGVLRDDAAILAVSLDA